MALATPHPDQDWLTDLLARIDALTVEIEAAGIDPRFARGAASALINYADAPSWGTQGLMDQRYAAGVLLAIRAFLAAQAQRVAA